ncbi:MAG: hypothetical protein JKX68_08785 [Flavobacteriales bacterium]|nr:hypothetical protein [Flavobacteriales bacterium]
MKKLDNNTIAKSTIADNSMELIPNLYDALIHSPHLMESLMAFEENLEVDGYSVLEIQSIRKDFMADLLRIEKSVVLERNVFDFNEGVSHYMLDDLSSGTFIYQLSA